MPQAGHYVQSHDAVATPVGDRIVLYHRVSRTALVLNPTGSWMWGQLDRGRTPGELAQQLRDRFPALSGADADRDVSAFLTDLARHAFIAVA